VSVTSRADIVVVAAGNSRRMGGLDKLEQQILGRPLISWTLHNMSLANCLRRLVLVVAPGQLERIRRAPWLPAGPVLVVAGGNSRSASVLAGLEASAAELVLVHDGARPLATAGLADAVALATAEHGAAVPVVPVVDSLKRVEQDLLTGVVEREGLARAQTPQGARRELLLEAFAAAGDQSFGDEAALLQAGGVPVASLPGEPLNIKVTEPADLHIVRALLAAQAGPTAQRQGSGTDSHPFGPRDGLWLGGILLAEAPRLYGHSDGDVALHALATAALAAAGMGDLGRFFPATDPGTRDAPSSYLLTEVLRSVERAGWRPSSAQLSLLGARPRLGAVRLDQMRLRLTELMGLQPDGLSLSASSGNLSGPEGAGLAISATASVTLVPR
jgi:2-C-methyl-D-erythritol 4-phosphate cytidylyltransferase / 2-C-methyl-D-erythritol 2,4-cyclodiphosphate synthase